MPAASGLTDQEVVAGVLVALLYVQGLDLSVGDAGTVLVNEEVGRSTGEVRHACRGGEGGGGGGERGS